MHCSQHRTHRLCSSDIIHNSTACLFIESFIDWQKHLHHLEWSSHGNRPEQKHPSLINMKIKYSTENNLSMSANEMQHVYFAPATEAFTCAFKQEQIQKIGVHHTSETLVACCHGKWALLHGQLVELAELWGDSSRGRL